MRPPSATELGRLVAEAAAAGTPLSAAAGNSKWDLGASPSATRTHIDLSELRGIVSYEPAELVLVVAAATPLAQIEDLLASEGQHLAFEPVYWRPEATAGGTVATAWAGPRRFCAGGVRDYILGLQFVDGRGRLVRSGGRVVKNVTGYDLWRGLAGSFGTLGLITEICFKLWPRPVSQQTLVLPAASVAAAQETMVQLAQRQEEISGLAYLPARRAVLARLEGRGDAIRARIDTLIGTWPAVQRLDETDSRQAWAALREVEMLRPPASDRSLWRFVVPPRQWVALVHDLEKVGLDRYIVDWGGGLVWALLADDADGHTWAARHAGIAWRIARDAADANARGLPQMSPGLAGLNARLKDVCDPHGILNPGRMPL